MIKVYNRYGEWLKPFRRIVANESIKCRFCEEESSHKLSRIQDKEGLDFNPYIDHGIKTKKIKKGETAFSVIFHSGPSGNFTICTKCAKLLLKNLQEEIES